MPPILVCFFGVVVALALAVVSWDTIDFLDLAVFVSDFLSEMALLFESDAFLAVSALEAVSSLDDL